MEDDKMVSKLINIRLEEDIIKTIRDYVYLHPGYTRTKVIKEGLKMFFKHNGIEINESLKDNIDKDSPYSIVRPWGRMDFTPR